MLTSCPNCAARLRVADEKVGQAVRCPKCNKVFRVPSQATMASPPASLSQRPKPPVEQRTSAKPTPKSLAKPFTGEGTPPAAGASAQPDQAKTIPEVVPEAAPSASRPKRKKKKKRSSNSTLVIVVGLGVFLGIAVLAGAGYAVWYFAFSRKSLDQAASELLEIMESFTAAVEKAKDASQRSQAISDIDAVTQRLERWIDKYKDLKYSDTEAQEVEKKYRARAEALGKRLLLAFFALIPQGSQDEQLGQALKRFAETLGRVPADLARRSRLQHGPSPKPIIPGSGTSPTPSWP